ncbi:MAG TPA: triose-phosphate isomerase [Alphaproteobacteria bacterium]|jgi:triosephosphate isomerase|nr:triose-phosphate isomerase [Alphaproteobacteria bacterium]
MDGARPLIAGNWKMNGLREEGVALATRLKQRAAAQAGLACDIVVCPPFTLLHEVGRALQGSKIALGAQDCHEGSPGAFTGDIAAAMLKDAGCRYVILGHSERRAGHGESDALVRRKAAAAHRTGLTAIVCVGETEAERDKGLTFDVIARQVENSLPDGAGAGNTVIAYEPVWAIGTGRTPNAEDIAANHRQIRAAVARAGNAGAIRVIYGGSVKADNAASLLAIPEVDGALVGGASLKADDFWAIVESCP